MSLSSLNLDAFLATAREKSFSSAAKKLHLTQSALSQRVLNLEKDLGSALFLRETAGIRLTELGERLLRYCQTREALEAEFLAQVQGGSSAALHGIVSVGAYSTIGRSVVLPALAGLLREHPALQLKFFQQELRELPGLLRAGKVDFIFGLQPLEMQGMENHHLGDEENILVEGLKGAPEIYLDHDEEDLTTVQFFRTQGKKAANLRRSYLDDIDSILEAVRLGVGKAVVPAHLVVHEKKIRAVAGYKPMKTPVYLSYYAQAYYTALQKTVIERLLREMPKYLARSASDGVK